MGFGLIDELQKLGYQPAKKCKATVMERPLTVSTAVFSMISGLKVGHVQSLCAQGLIPSVRVGKGGRFKYQVEWESAVKKLKEYAESGALLPCVIDKNNPVTIDTIKRTIIKKSRQKKGVDYRRLPEDVLQKKKILKAK